MNRPPNRNLFEVIIRLQPFLLLVGFAIFASTLKAERPGMCMSFIDTAYVETTIVNCNNSATICIEAAIADMLSYTITDNGMPYSGSISPCDFDTSFAYTYSSIPGAGTGPYQIDSWSVNGMNFQGLVNDMAALTDSMNLWDPGGGWMLDVATTTIRGGISSSLYSNIELTEIASGTAATINLNTTLNPKGASMSIDTGFHQIIFLDPNDGCLDTVDVQVNCIACPEVYSGPKVFEVDNCNDQQVICVDLTSDELSQYTITDNGLVYSGSLPSCSTDSFYVYDYSTLPGGGTAGPYQLQSWSVNGSVFLGGFADVITLVDSMNVWDPTGDWTIDVSDKTISGGLVGNTYGNIELLQIVGGATGTAMVQGMASITSVELSLDTGFHDIVFLNNSNQCEASFDFEINCIACPEYFNDSPILATADHCDSITPICLGLPFAELLSWSIIVNDNAYGGIVDACMVTNTQITLDTGSYELVLFNMTTMCSDTTDVVIDCTPIICTDFIAAETFSNLATSCSALTEVCVDLPFSAQGDYEIFDNATLYTGSITDCDNSTGLSLAVGNHDLVFVHLATGCRDSISGLIECLSPNTLNLSITAGETDTVCLDTSVLPGNVASMVNFCEGDAGELVIYSLDTANVCVIYEGIEEGTESACIEVCDDLGFCDTTYINVAVTMLVVEPPGDTLPIANDEFVFTVEDIDVTINILGNDTINGILDTIGIASEPDNGLVLVVDDQILYIPDNGFCSSIDLDTFEYFICNSVGCDTAEVTVEVSCESFEINNGFSPNGDGVNDYFVIQGVYAYPNNTLSVFNRWGNQIFNAIGYQNNWDGTWEGTDLPNGTYFYYFDNGEGSIASGYLLLHR